MASTWYPFFCCSCVHHYLLIIKHFDPLANEAHMYQGNRSSHLLLIGSRSRPTTSRFFKAARFTHLLFLSSPSLDMHLIGWTGHGCDYLHAEAKQGTTTCNKCRLALDVWVTGCRKKKWSVHPLDVMIWLCVAILQNHALVLEFWLASPINQNGRSSM